MPRPLDYAGPPLPWWRREWSPRGHRRAALVVLALVGCALAYPWIARHRDTGRWGPGPSLSPPRSDEFPPQIGPPDRGPAATEPAD